MGMQSGWGSEFIQITHYCEALRIGIVMVSAGLVSMYVDRFCSAHYG